jgi:hypothetical protein
MAIEVDIDVLLLKSEIRKTYACVSDEPDRDFIFPTGRSAGSRRASASSISVPVPGPDRRSAPAGRR